MSTYQAAREDEIFNKQRDILAACGIAETVVFDVGANAGQSIERYRALSPGCRIHAFEPIPDLFEKLKGKFGADPELFLHPVALAETASDLPFYVTCRPEMSSLLKPEPWLAEISPDRKYDFSTIDVQVDTLDAICDALSVEFIHILKIDVQGAELRVLKGGGRMLAKKKIGLIYLEVNMAETYVEQMQMSDLLNFLTPLGYQLWDILPFVFTGAGRAWTANALFVCPDWIRTTESFFRSQTGIIQE
jgi:FkbM family methyltransferase